MDLTPPPTHRPVFRPDARVLRVRVQPYRAESAGVLFGRTLKTNGLTELLVTRLEACGREDLRIIVVASEEDTTPPDLTISIEKAYVQTLHDTKTGVVVLRIEQGDTVRHLRGQDTGLNWWGTGDEMAAAIGNALDRALAQLRPDFPALARPAPPAAEPVR